MVRPSYEYRRAYLDRMASSRLLDQTLALCAWQEEWVTLFGRTRRVPRLVAWSGDRGVCYRYSGRDHVADGWPEPLAALRRRVSVDLDQPINFVLMNRYRDGNDTMGWHTDGERGLAGCIASISLGASRRLLLKEDGRTTRLDLEDGSLLVWPVRQNIPHTVPRTRHPVGERINLTFRWVRSC